jgi:NitT/TauT family transport system ATP-binding protein
MMTMEAPLSQTSCFLEARQISHVYTRRMGRQMEALQNVSLSLEPGKVLSLVGMSGCGKSTLLRIVAGLIQPTAGEIWIDGLSPLAYQQTKGMGFVFQKSLLFPWRTILENILLPVEVRSGAIRSEHRDRAHSLMKMLGLTGFEESYPRQLSGGMLQRAAIARALITQPKLLLLDEPFSALDEITRENLWLDFGEIWRSQGLNVILVTHSTREAVFLADHVCVMSPRPGRVKTEFRVDEFPDRNRSLMMQPRFLELCESVRSHLS